MKLIFWIILVVCNAMNPTKTDQRPLLPRRVTQQPQARLNRAVAGGATPPLPSVSQALPTGGVPAWACCCARLACSSCATSIGGSMSEGKPPWPLSSETMLRA